MKRKFFLIPLCMLSALCLTSCQKPLLSRVYDGDVSISGTEYSATAHLTNTEDSMTLTFTAPESLSGLSYTYTDGELHTSLGELDCITPDSALPSAAPPQTLYTVMSALDTAQYQSSENGADTYLLPTSLGKLPIKARDGELLSLTVGDITYSFCAS